LQRLFSNFASGWPGAGILLQRGLTGFLLIHEGIVQSFGKAYALSTIPEGAGVVAGILLLLGLWTPIAGILAAVAEIGVLLTGTRQPLIAVMVATLGITLAMIGPGAWSLDARFFGRKHIEARWPIQK
jgi:putative oxidoreductase